MQSNSIYQQEFNSKLGCFKTKRHDQDFGVKNKVTGYRSISLRLKNGLVVREYMHRAIFQATTGIIIPKGFQVHHRDADKDNNSIDNLCMCTSRFNNLEAAKTRDYAKIYKSRKKNGFKQKIKAICGEWEQVYPSMNQCAKALGIWPSRISNIITGALPYPEAYSKTTRKKYKFVKVKK